MKTLIARLFGVTVLVAILGMMLSACQAGTRQDRLVYNGPTEVSVDAGDRIPGTDIRYMQRIDQGAEVRIGNEKAIRQVGDSLDYEGRPTTGVHMDLALRVVWSTEETMHSAGTIALTVRNPSPEETPIDTESEFRYAVPVMYWVYQGDTIPGTSITYVGRTDQGAELDGIEGYAYRKGADSILWEGKLREDVWLKLDLRTGIYDDNRLQVAGLATIWVDQ